MKRLQNILKELFVFVSADSAAAPILSHKRNDFRFFVGPGEYHNAILVWRLLPAVTSERNDFWFFVVPGEYHNAILVRRLLPAVTRGRNDLWFFVGPGLYQSAVLVRRFLAAGASREVNRLSDESDMN